MPGLALALSYPMLESSSVAPALDRTLGYSFRDPSLQTTPDIDIVLMDIMMPEMDGNDTTRAIRQMSQFRHLPIVAVTAKAMKGDREKCLEAGAWDYLSKPVDPEKMLAVLRAWLVRQSTLARLARQLGLGPHLQLGRGEARGGGRERPALLSRGFEAVIGAVYLDGGLEAARTVLLPLVDQEIQVGFSPQRVVDAKSRLQQVTQARFDSTPVYNLVDHSGPGHAPLFVVEVKAGPEILARGNGRSKRAAQQAAAHAALQQLDVKEGYEEPLDEFDESE